MNKEFWKGKRVLISGHSGFKGSWLCLWLNKLGAKVYGFSLLDPPTQPSLYDLADVRELLSPNIYAGDITEYSSIKDAINIFKPEIVFHMAAQTIVKEGFIHPLETFKTNIIGTANLLQACKEVGGIKSIVVVTTDKVYEDQQWPWGYRETDPLGANDPYSTSKACAELITATYRQDKLGDLPIATARAGNVIAGGDWSYRVVPMIMEALIKGEKPPIWDPTAIRPWQHVLDCLDGYMILAKKLYEGPNPYLGSWNFGPSEEDYITVGELTDFMCQTWTEENLTYDKVQCPVPYNLEVDLRLNSSRARRLLGWKPRWNTYKAANRTVNWYRSLSRGWSARDLVYNDIKMWEVAWDIV